MRVNFETYLSAFSARIWRFSRFFWNGFSELFQPFSRPINKIWYRPIRERFENPAQHKLHFHVRYAIDNLIIPIYILRFDFHWTQFHLRILSLKRDWMLFSANQRLRWLRKRDLPWLHSILLSSKFNSASFNLILNSSSFAFSLCG